MRIVGHSIRVSLLTACVFGSGHAAKTPATLISEFNSLFKGRTARMVWQKDGQGWPGVHEGSGTNTLKKLDTKDGIVKTFVTGKGYMARPCFTWDGERVIFTDLNSSTIYAANWSDGTVKMVVSGYESGGCYFYQGKHWVIANAASPGAPYRINIDAPSEKVKLGDRNCIWPSISPDGQYVAALWPGFGHAGVLNVSTGAIKEFTNPAGCWPTMARDNSHNTLYTIEPHTEIRIVTPTESQVVRKRVVGLGGAGEEYNILRWTMDPDICTYMIDNENSNNPYVFRISDGTGVYIMQPESGAEGNMDIFFPGWNPPGISPVAVDVPKAVHGIDAGFVATATGKFDVQGRSLADGHKLLGGVYVVRLTGTNGQTRHSLAARIR